MIQYNNDSNAYCSTVNAQNVETREHNSVEISSSLHTKKTIFLFTFRNIHLHL